MVIYDWADNAREISISRKIKEIYVSILTGDETGTILLDDGTSISFDASPDRLMDCFDGDYVVPEFLVDDWINWKPYEKSDLYSYQRQFWFGKRWKEALNDDN